MTAWPIADGTDLRTLERIAALVAEVEGEAEGEGVLRHAAHPRYRPLLTRSIEIDGELAAAVLLEHQRRLVDGRPLETGYIANILTRPRYRGRGLFKALMLDALAVLRSEGIPLALLHGPRSLYEQFGFAPVFHHALCRLPAAAAAELPKPDRVTLSRVADADDLAALYSATYREMPLAEERTPAVWRWRLSWPGETLVARDRGERAAAYAVVGERVVSGWMRVVEGAAADGRAALAMLGHLCELAARRGLHGLHLPLAPDHPLHRAALLAGGESLLAGPHLDPGSREGHEDQGLVLDLPLALQQLAPALSRRLARSRYAGWRGRAGIRTEAEIAILEIDGDTVSIDGDAAAVAGNGWTQTVLQAPSPLLAPLLLGTYGASELLGWDGVTMPETAHDLFAALFPPLWPVSESEEWWQQ